jgi:ABC-type nitrate/sulfonate/bicarbonate transport system permease component
MSAVDLDLTDVGATPVTDVARAAVARPSTPSRLARVGPLLTVALVVVAWEVAGRTEVFGPQSLPAPTAILRQLWNDRSIYPGNIRTTLREAWPGFLWGNLAAIALGIVFVHIPLFERLLSGVMVCLMCMPLVAIGPVLAIVFSGDAPKSILAGLSCFFLTLVATVLGMRSADRAAIDVVRAGGGGWWKVLRLVRFRSSLPMIVVALRLAAPSALLGAILGEFLGGVNGIGVTMMGSMAQLETERTWGLAMVATALGALGYYGIGLAARLLGIAEVAPPSGSAPARSKAQRALPARVAIGTATFAVSSALTVLLWLAFVRGLHLNSFFAKTPGDVWRFLVSGPNAGEHRGVVRHALGQTLPVTALGYLAGLAAACTGAVVFVLWRGVERAIMPFALIVQSIPLAALTPLLVLLFGRGLLATVMVSVLVTFFPSLVAITHGMRSASAQMTDVLRTYDASRFTILRRVQVPCAIPALFAAARVSAPRALLGVLIAEYLATGVGVGWMLNLAKTRSEFTLVWAAAAVITLISVAAYVVVGWLERVMLARYAPEVMA